MWLGEWVYRGKPTLGGLFSFLPPRLQLFVGWDGCESSSVSYGQLTGA